MPPHPPHPARSTCVARDAHPDNGRLRRPGAVRLYQLLEHRDEQLGDKPDAVVAEIAGIDSLPLTQDQSQGFSDALADCGLSVSNRVAGEFAVESGEAAASNLLQAASGYHDPPPARRRRAPP